MASEASFSASSGASSSLLICSSSPSSSSSGYDTDGSSNVVVKAKCTVSRVKTEQTTFIKKQSEATSSLHVYTDSNNRKDNGNNNNNNDGDGFSDSPANVDAPHGFGSQCSCCDMRDEDLEVSPSLPKLGRKQPINVVTIFAKGDDKRHLLDCPDLITIHDLNPREDLIEQWDRLSLPPQGPDLILAKLHKALGSRDLKPTAAALMKNYESLRQHHWSVFQRLELVPLETEVILTNRFAMQDLIDKVCNAVNLTLGSSSAGLKTTEKRLSTSTEKHPFGSTGKRASASTEKRPLALTERRPLAPRLSASRPTEAEEKLSEILSASKSVRSIRSVPENGDGGNCSPSKYGASKDGASKDGATKNGATKDGAPKDVAPKDGATKDGDTEYGRDGAPKGVPGSVEEDDSPQRSICSKPKSVRMQFSMTSTPTVLSSSEMALQTSASEMEGSVNSSSASVASCCSSAVTVSSSSTTLSMSLSEVGVSSTLPPFPLVVKSSSTSTKGMAMVLDETALRHFASTIVGGGVVIEQFVQHDNAILKMYVIGREIFVVRRRSLPNVLSFTEAAVKQFATDVDGEFVPLAESSVGGYVVYQSDKMPKTNHGVTLLEECSDLDGTVLRLLTQALARELRVDLFGFDVLIESNTRNIFVVDVNVLPGFKGVPSSQRRLCAWLSFLATRRAFKEDCLSLLPQDLLRLSLSRNDEEPRVNLETLQVRQITQNRIFEVMFKERLDSPGARTRHTLVKFRPVQTPRRFIEDKDHFVSNLAKVLASKGLGPSFIKDVSAVYFDRRRHLGMVRDWIEGAPLQVFLTHLHDVRPGGAVSSRLDAIFRGVGVALARFHLLGEDVDFRRGIVERHFPGALSTPVVFRLLEQWRRDAVLALLCSRAALETSDVWGNLYAGVIEASRNLDDVIGVVLERISTPEAARAVFGHFDANVNNIIVCNTEKSGELGEEEEQDGQYGGEGRRGSAGERVAEIFLIDEEWAAPNVAIYDFAKFVTSVSVLMARKLTKLSEAELRRGTGLMAGQYLKTMMADGVNRRKTSTDEDVDEEQGLTAEKVEDFVKDVWTFVPLAALTNCFSNLVHASKEGQLSAAEIPKSDELFQPDGGAFNWLRHAQDHLSVFRKHFNALSSAF